MQNVKIERIRLLETVKANRESHRDVFLKAVEGYRKKVIEVLDRQLDEAKRGIRYNAHVSLTEPKDQTADYDRVISMLEYSVDETIVLSQAEFASYVQDQWSWKGQFTTTTSQYVA